VRRARVARSGRRPEAIRSARCPICKDVVRLSGDDRDLSLTFMHGYWLGKKDATEFVANSLGQASDDFIEYCLDHPNDNALQSMGKFLK
jgi:hypothetical protein